jgi:hypothetical protein
VHGKGSSQAKAVAAATKAGARPGYLFLHSAVDGYSRLAYTEALDDEKARWRRIWQLGGFPFAGWPLRADPGIEQGYSIPLNHSVRRRYLRARSRSFR